MNRGRVSPVMLVLVLIVIFVVAFVAFSRRTSPSPTQVTPMPSGGQGRMQGRGPGAGPGQMGQPGTGAMQGASSQRSLSDLGITGKPSRGETPGLLITGFISTPEKSPINTLGVKKGDVIISCNGEQRQMGDRLGKAIEGLQQRGEKITLVVIRDGKEVTLERTEKLPESVVSQKLKAK